MIIVPFAITQINHMVRLIMHKSPRPIAINMFSIAVTI